MAGSVLLCLMLSACAVHWPWKHHRPKPPPPPPIHYVTVSNPWDGVIRQFWDRNTLKLDLTGLSGEGEAIVAPVESVGWPVRLEFAVRPGSFTRLEVVAAQRVIYAVPGRGRIMILKLDPSALTPTTGSVTLQWSEVADSEP
jgi:hypothetical protein